jgi:hypothetical protein
MLLRAHDELTGDVEPDIRGAVRGMLAACAIYEPPTPLDRLLDYRNLESEQQEALTPGHLQLWARKLRHHLWKFHHKVRGILDLKARTVMVDASLHPKRREFLQFHEVGHDVLDWHRDLFVVTSEWDLNPGVRSKFEAEANHFAATAIFQIDDLAEVQRGRRLQMAQLAGLATRYGASLTATARHYITIQDLPAALLIGRPTGPAGGRGIRFIFGLANGAFLREFGNELLGSGVDSNNPMSATLNVPMLRNAEFEFPISDRRGESRLLAAETMYNTYNTLTLVHPLPSARRVFTWPTARQGRVSAA